MRLEILWFIVGAAAALGAGAGFWMILLIVKNKQMKKQISELMHNKGVLTMRISFLEEALKEKEP